MTLESSVCSVTGSTRGKRRGAVGESRGPPKQAITTSFFFFSGFFFVCNPHLHSGSHTPRHHHPPPTTFCTLIFIFACTFFVDLFHECSYLFFFFLFFLFFALHILPPLPIHPTPPQGCYHGLSLKVSCLFFSNISSFFKAFCSCFTRRTLPVLESPAVPRTPPPPPPPWTPRQRCRLEPGTASSSTCWGPWPGGTCPRAG